MCVIVLGLGPTTLSTALNGEIRRLQGEPFITLDTVIVENSSGPEGHFVGTNQPYEVLRHQANLGYAAAMNNAANLPAARKADRLIFLTADVEPTEGTLLRLLTALNDPTIGLSAPIIETGDAQWFGGSWHPRWGWARHNLTTPFTDEFAGIVDISWSDGACLCIRRSDFQRVEGFDAGTFLYGEDLQLCQRLLGLGRRVVLVPDGRVRQSSGMNRRPGAHGYLLVRNEIRVLRLLGPRGATLSGSVTGLARAGFECCRALRTAKSRRMHAQQSVGMVWGVVAGLRSVQGPPPPTLRRWGDIKL